VEARVNGFLSNLGQGVLLVGIVVLLSVGLRASIIVMLAIPLPLIIGIGFVDKAGFGLQQMSIVGLVIALGLLVDNAIVVTENVSRFLKKGRSQVDTAMEGTSQIGWAIVSSTVTTVLAFIPIIFMPDETGDFIRGMPVTVVFTLSASLLLALTLTPYLSSRILKYKEGQRISPVQHLLNWVIEKPYRATLRIALRLPWMIVVFALITFAGSLALFPLVGISFFPKAEKPQFYINITTPNGSSLDKTDHVVQVVEAELAKMDEIKHWSANIGRSNPRIYYGLIPKHKTPTHAQIFVELKNRKLEQWHRR